MFVVPVPREHEVRGKGETELRGLFIEFLIAAWFGIRRRSSRRR